MAFSDNAAYNLTFTFLIIAYKLKKKSAGFLQALNRIMIIEPNLFIHTGKDNIIDSLCQFYIIFLIQ